MTPDLDIGEGDLLPPLAVQLLNEDGTFPDLIGKTVRCVVTADACGGARFESDADVVDARAGFVSHAWAAPETRLPGNLLVYFVVNDPTGITPPVPYPPNRFYRVRVLPALR